MKELKCYNLEVISGSSEYDQLRIASIKHKKGSFLAVIFYPIVAVVLGYLLLMFGAMSIMLTIASFSRPLFDLTNIFFMLASIALDLFTAAIFVPTFIMVVGFLNSVKTILTKNHNIATKIFVGENYEEIKKLTTSGIFGLFYGKFIDSFRKTIGRGTIDKMEKGYQNGGIVLITPYSKFPLIKGNYEIEILGVSSYLVITIMFHGQAVAVAITDRENKELIQSKVVSI